MADHTLHPDTKLGYVHLTISDLDRSVAFYQDTLGFQLHERLGNQARMGAGGSDILVLTEQANAQRFHGTTGLYHFAVLVPSRLELARSLRRLGEKGWPLQGVADHWVSEAVYLPDPDGNGIEIYRDRPRAEWPRLNGQLQMATEPLDLEGVMAELSANPEPSDGLHRDTILGHMHLHVADIAAAEAFYIGALGFDLILHFGPSAGFVSAGGYHHHVGFNTWGTAGAPPAPPDAIGLREFVVLLPEASELASAKSRLETAGVKVEEADTGFRVRDPSQNGLLLTVSD